MKIEISDKVGGEQAKYTQFYLSFMFRLDLYIIFILLGSFNSALYVRLCVTEPRNLTIKNQDIMNNIKINLVSNLEKKQS